MSADELLHGLSRTGNLLHKNGYERGKDCKGNGETSKFYLQKGARHIERVRPDRPKRLYPSHKWEGRVEGTGLPKNVESRGGLFTGAAGWVGMLSSRKDEVRSRRGLRGLGS